MSMTATWGLATRMRSMLLARAPADVAESVADVVTWFGAMQAQDYASGLWSLGCRLPASSRAGVEDALERREALRTWPMRGTIHLVPARDARWMVDVLGERALQGAAKRRANLGLEEPVAERAVHVLADALAGGGRLTRSQCLVRLQQEDIPTAGSLGYHLLRYASQRGVLCIAPHLGSEQTFALLEDWVPDPHWLSRDEALGTIARRYIRSHGPVTRQDFVGWTGLKADDAIRALSTAGDAITAIDVDGIEMLVSPEALDAAAREPDDDVLVLPAFDEYLLGVKDRSLVLDDRHTQAVIPGGNGVFQATLVRGGRVVGTWKRAITGRRTVVTIHPLTRLAAGDRRSAEVAVGRYADFIGTPSELRWA